MLKPAWVMGVFDDVQKATDSFPPPIRCKLQHDCTCLHFQNIPPLIDRDLSKQEGAFVLFLCQLLIGLFIHEETSLQAV